MTPTSIPTRTERRPGAGSLLVVVALCALGQGCASARPETPVEVVHAQADHLSAGDVEAARRLLTEQARLRAPQWPARDALPSRGATREVRRRASWDRAGAAPLSLERSGSGWSITQGVLGLMRARTPDEAVESFARAILSRDWEALLQLMPGAVRAGWSAADVARHLEDPRAEGRWRALAEALTGAGRAVVMDTAQRARVSAGEVGVVLVREDDGWKVFDVLPASIYKRP